MEEGEKCTGLKMEELLNGNGNGARQCQISLGRCMKFAKLKEMVKRSILILSFNS